MNKSRLLKLADLLEADAKNKKGIKFDISMWGAVEDESNPLSCGTTACAIGLAALSGKFKRCGLTAKIASSGLIQIRTPHAFGGVSSAMDVFAISYDAAMHLFMPSTYRAVRGARGERAVAKRIRDFVAGKATP